MLVNVITMRATLEQKFICHEMLDFGPTQLQISSASWPGRFSLGYGALGGIKILLGGQRL